MKERFRVLCSSFVLLLTCVYHLTLPYIFYAIANGFRIELMFSKWLPLSFCCVGMTGFEPAWQKWCLAPNQVGYRYPTFRYIVFRAPGGIRTHTVKFLRLVPPAVGLQTHFVSSPLPVSLLTCSDYLTSSEHPLSWSRVFMVANSWSSKIKQDLRLHPAP